MHPRSVNVTTVVVRAHDNSHGGNKSGQVDDQHQEERRRQQHQKFTSMICSTCEKVEKVREASANDVTFFEKKKMKISVTLLWSLQVSLLVGMINLLFHHFFEI